MRRSGIILIASLAAILVLSGAWWKHTVLSRRAVLNDHVDRTKAVILRLAIDVSQLSKQDGGLPTNAEQLVRVLGTPLPRTAWNTDISYFSTNGYFLIQAHTPYPEFLILEFDSRKAANGVTTHSF